MHGEMRGLYKTARLTSEIQAEPFGNPKRQKYPKIGNFSKQENGYDSMYFVGIKSGFDIIKGQQLIDRIRSLWKITNFIK